MEIGIILEYRVDDEDQAEEVLNDVHDALNEAGLDNGFELNRVTFTWD